MGPGSLMLAHEFIRNALSGGLVRGARLRSDRLVRRCCAVRCSPGTRSATWPSARRRSAAAAASGVDAARRACSRADGRGFGSWRDRRAWGGSRISADDVTIGVVFSLGAGDRGAAIAVPSARAPPAVMGRSSPRTLFGSIFGLVQPRHGRRAAAAIGLAGSAACCDCATAAVRDARSRAWPACAGVPVRALGLALLVLIGIVAAEATQAVGALLRARVCWRRPAGAAQRLTAKPYLGHGAVDGDRARGRCGVGIALSYVVPSLPPSTRDRGARGRRLRALVDGALPSRYELVEGARKGNTIEGMSDIAMTHWVERAEAKLRRPATSAAARDARCSSCSAARACALTAVEIEDALRLRRAAREPSERLPHPGGARAACGWCSAWRPARRWCATSACAMTRGAPPPSRVRRLWRW